VGACAISGGVHRGGYAEANDVDTILPVDVYIPDCPTHPWTIIYGILLAMGKMEQENALLAKGNSASLVQ
jgi:NADH:ubiquinone oxidoreductase subunit B-like Fe-S oxidoreductase